MRRLLVPTLCVTAVVGLAACDGTTHVHASRTTATDLDDAKARAALVDASVLGGGFRSGAVTNDRPTHAKTPFAEVSAAPQACKDAAKDFADDAKAAPKAYAKRVLARPDTGANVQVGIQVGDDVAGLPAKLARISAACRTIRYVEGDGEVTITSTSPDLGVEGAASLQTTVTVGTAKIVTDLGLKAIGHNLAMVQSTSDDESTAKDLAGKALRAQVDKVQKATS